MRRCLALISALCLSALALAGSAAGAGRLYVPSYGSGPPEVVGGFERGSDGSLTPLGGFPVSPGPPFAVGGFIGLAFSPAGERAVASFLFNGGVQGLSAAPDGSIAPAGAPIVAPSVTGLAVSPDGRFAYAPTRTFGGTNAVGILGYALGADGSLTPLAGSPFGSGEVGDLAVTPDGRFLYAVAANEVQRFSVGADGSLAALGSTPVGGARLLATSPDGRLLLVGVGGGGDGVASFSIGPEGDLAENGPPALTGDTAMGFFAVAPDGDHLYMPDSNLDGIVTAAVATDGRLSVVDTTPLENPVSVAASPDGRFLYYHRSSDELGAASIGPEGVPTVLPSATVWDTGEPERLVLQPRPAPTASFTSEPGAPGAGSRFDASDSVGVVRFDWDFGDGTTLTDGGPKPTHQYARAGVYEVKLTVVDAGGCSASAVYTGQSTVCPGGSSATATGRLDTPPRLSAFELVNRKFAVEARAARKGKVKRGSAFRFRLSERAKVRIKIKRAKGGRKIGTIKTPGKRGKNRTEFSGRLRGKQLEPGRYRAIAIAKDSAGGRSKEKRVSFRVIRG